MKLWIMAVTVATTLLVLSGCTSPPPAAQPTAAAPAGQSSNTVVPPAPTTAARPASPQAASPTAPAAASASNSPQAAGAPSRGSLATSKMIGLTKLTEPQLCGTLSTAEAAQILGAPSQAPQFTSTLGLGIICEWQKAGVTKAGVTDELYVGLSTVMDWTGAQAIDKLFKTTQSTIGGHPAIIADKQEKLDYAVAHVALGGDHDPVAEFRAPTTSAATQMATIVVPRLLAFASGS